MTDSESTMTDSESTTTMKLMSTFMSFVVGQFGFKDYHINLCSCSGYNNPSFRPSALMTHKSFSHTYIEGKIHLYTLSSNGAQNVIMPCIV